MTFSLRLLTATALLACTSVPAIACTFSATPERSARNVASADIIFEGQVLDVAQPLPGDTTQTAQATLRISKLHKGAPLELLMATYSLGTTSCGHVLHPGDMGIFFAKLKDGTWTLNSQSGSYYEDKDLPPGVVPPQGKMPRGYVSGENLKPLAPEDSDRISTTLPQAITGCSGLIKLTEPKTYNDHYVNLGYVPAAPLRIDGQVYNVFNISLPLTSDLTDFGPIALTTDTGFYQSTACSPDAFSIFKTYLRMFKN